MKMNVNLSTNPHIRMNVKIKLNMKLNMTMEMNIKMKTNMTLQMERKCCRFAGHPGDQIKAAGAGGDRRVLVSSHRSFVEDAPREM
jgi:hypothetical protein